MSFNVNNVAVNTAYFNGSEVKSIYYNNTLIWEFIAYEELEYIESTGTQYIDTGFKPNQDTRVVASFELSNSNTQSIFGGRVAYQDNDFSFWVNNSAWLSNYNAGSNTISGTIIGRHSLDKNKNITTIDSSSATGTTGTFQSPANLCIFACNNNGTVDSRMSSMKLYSFKIYDNGTLVRDFVPAKLPTGEVGLWDKVNRVFYGNDGTGSFTGKSFEEVYVEIDYIQSSGTQYINTGFMPNNNTRVVMDAHFTSTPTATSGMFGARVSATDRNYAFLYTSAGIFRSDYNNAYTQEWSVDATTRRIYDKNKETTTVDGTSQSYTNASFQVPNNLYLCASNNAGTASWLSSMKIYSCQIYDNDVLVRDFIPVQLIDDYSIGLYDKVNKRFYGNAGSGEFTCETAPLTIVWPDGSNWASAGWENIYNLCKAKQAGTITEWPKDVVLGATKTVSLSTAVLGATSVEMMLIGIDIDGDGVLTFDAKNTLPTTVAFTTTTTGIWSNSPARTQCQNFYKYCEAKPYIKTLRKGYTTNTSGVGSGRNGTVAYQNETVFLLSEREYGNNTYSQISVANSTTTKAECTYGVNAPYPYYNSDASRIKYRINGGTTNYNYWTRSRGSTTSNCFICGVIGSTGKANTYPYKNGTTVSALCISPAFAIG